MRTDVQNFSHKNLLFARNSLVWFLTIRSVSSSFVYSFQSNKEKKYIAAIFSIVELNNSSLKLVAYFLYFSRILADRVQSTDVLTALSSGSPLHKVRIIY